MNSRPVRNTACVPAPSDTTGADERALVVRVRSGEPQAFEVLFQRYYEPLVGIVMTYVHSQAVAEERVQEIFLRVWVHHATWQVQGALAPYFYSAARHEAVNYLKHQRVVDQWDARAAYDTRASGMGQGPVAPDQALETRDMERALARAVARLPERRRLAFTLRSQYHMSNAEVAAYMGVTVKAVEKTLALALDVLRRDLAAAGVL